MKSARNPLRHVMPSNLVFSFIIALMTGVFIPASALPAPPASNVFQDNFETGSLARWSSHVGGPDVSWSTNPVRYDITIGTRQRKTIVLRADEDLPATVLEVTPGLSSLIQVHPATLPVISRGTEVSIELTIRATAPGEQSGTLHVRQADGPPRTFARPLAITLNGVADSGIPPEPDPTQNNATLLGIDTNGNLVRDDIERYIIQNWTSPNDRNALFQYHRALAKTYVPQTYQEATTAIDGAQSCILSLRDPYEAPDSETLVQLFEISRGMILSIRRETLNTVDRTRAYLAYNHSLSGTSETVEPNRIEDCTFVVEVAP